MARGRSGDGIDLSESHGLTVGRIDALACPPGRSQVFLRDSKAPGLRVRVTTSGAKAFVFEGKLDRQTIRQTIGDVRAWSIADARVEANRLRKMLDDKVDPRHVERERIQQMQLRRDAAAAHSTTVAQAW